MMIDFNAAMAASDPTGEFFGTSSTGVVKLLGWAQKIV